MKIYSCPKTCYALLLGILCLANLSLAQSTTVTTYDPEVTTSNLNHLQGDTDGDPISFWLDQTQSNTISLVNAEELLVWENNGAHLNAKKTFSINMSSGIVPELSTMVSITIMDRIWNVAEISDNSPTVKVKIPQNTVSNVTGVGNYYMFIADNENFNTSSEYRSMTIDGNGNLEASYNFNGIKYITFGYAPRVTLDRSVYFNGITSYIETDDSVHLNPQGFTISAWIKRDETDSGTSTILSKRNTEFTQGYDLTILDDNRIQIFWKNGTNQKTTSNTAIPDNEWHQVAITYNGNTIKLYIDGVLEKTALKTAPLPTEDLFLIGAACNDLPTQHFKGHIDEVRIWNSELSKHQLRFIMNQEIVNDASIVAGKELPNYLTKNDVHNLQWANLTAYYPMSNYTFSNTEDASGNEHDGILRNINTLDIATPPLPYISINNGDWDNKTTWQTDEAHYIPGSKSIVNDNKTIDWNIVKTTHDIAMDNSSLPVNNANNRSLLSLNVEDETLTLSGNSAVANGNGVTITHYLALGILQPNAKIDLEGESQLIQTLESDFEPTSIGVLEKEQQGSADTYTYNYWSSPVGLINPTSNNNTYQVREVMFDGIEPIAFLNSGYNGTNGSPIGIADYWIWKFANKPDQDYSAWQHVRRNGNIFAGEGFTMKGPGTGSILDEQNYVFLGKPNNGDITLTLNSGNDYLVGNPYPSAIDANKFIRDNGPNESNNSSALISGTLYFWEHWSGGNHNTGVYKGGYSTYNLSGATPAAYLQSLNQTNSSTGFTIGSKLPGRYIPVCQGFYVIGNDTGTIKFNNSQRLFKKESSESSTFLRTTSSNNETNDDIDTRMKFRIGFNSVSTTHRQLLLTIDDNATTGYDWGYDGEVYDNQIDDLYWMIDGKKYTIQGSNSVEISTVYPLGIKTQSAGTNKISIEALENVPDTISIYIYDTENDTFHDLRDSEYETYLPSGEHFDRFKLTFSNSQNVLSSSDNDLHTLHVYYNNENETIVLYNPNRLDINSIELYNILGQPITTIDHIIDSEHFEYEVKNLSSGAYIIKMNNETGTVTKKVLIR